MNRIIRTGQLWQLVLAHAKELMREPGVLFWGILFPILMSLGLGIAFTKKADTIRNVAVIREVQENSTISDTLKPIEVFLVRVKAKEGSTRDGLKYREVIMKDDKLGNTLFHFRFIDWQSAMVLLKRGNINLILSEKDGRINYHFDPMNPDAQLIYLKLSDLFNNPEIISREGNGNIVPLTVSGTRYIDFLIPGLIAMGVMMSCMWGISYGIIDNRSKKLLRRMVATPMKKSHYLVALISVRFVMNVIESLLLFLFAWLAFGISVQGSLPALFLLFLAGNLAFAGIAIFISSHTSKTEIGNGLINAVVTPMMVLSGIFFSYHNFPDWSLSFIKPLPLTIFADGIRSIFIEGAGIAETGLAALILATIGILFFAGGLKIFKWH